MRISKSSKTEVKASTGNRSSRFEVGKDFNTKDWWVYDNNTDSKKYYFDTEDEAKDFVDTIINLPDYSDTLPYGGYDPNGSVNACGDVKASKKLSANDQALKHIKAAIDILGKSGNTDAVTKDSIANLGVVMFDLKSKK